MRLETEYPNEDSVDAATKAKAKAVTGVGKDGFPGVRVELVWAYEIPRTVYEVLRTPFPSLVTLDIMACLFTLGNAEWIQFSFVPSQSWTVECPPSSVDPTLSVAHDRGPPFRSTGRLAGSWAGRLVGL